MPNYYVNKNADDNNNHEVHTYDCDQGADDDNQLDLGFHLDCHGAVKKAKKTYDNVDGCYYCSNDCHEGK